jgi:sRNA-binding carbon storage regulator CsrA
MLKVTVLEIGRGRVRLGFEGADKFPVNRWEVWQRIRAGYQPEGQPNGPPPLIAQ